MSAGSEDILLAPLRRSPDQSQTTAVTPSDSPPSAHGSSCDNDSPDTEDARDTGPPHPYKPQNLTHLLQSVQIRHKTSLQAHGALTTESHAVDDGIGLCKECSMDGLEVMQWLGLGDGSDIEIVGIQDPDRAKKMKQLPALLLSDAGFWFGGRVVRAAVDAANAAGGGHEERVAAGTEWLQLRLAIKDEKEAQAIVEAAMEKLGNKSCECADKVMRSVEAEVASDDDSKSSVLEKLKKKKEKATWRSADENTKKWFDVDHSTLRQEHVLPFLTAPRSDGGAGLADDAALVQAFRSGSDETDKKRLRNIVLRIWTYRSCAFPERQDWHSRTFDVVLSDFASTRCRTINDLRRLGGSLHDALRVVGAVQFGMLQHAHVSLVVSEASRCDHDGGGDDTTLAQSTDESGSDDDESKISSTDKLGNANANTKNKNNQSSASTSSVSRQLVGSKRKARGTSRVVKRQRGLRSEQSSSSNQSSSSSSSSSSVNKAVGDDQSDNRLQLQAEAKPRKMAFWAVGRLHEPIQNVQIVVDDETKKERVVVTEHERAVSLLAVREAFTGLLCVARVGISDNECEVLDKLLENGRAEAEQNGIVPVEIYGPSVESGGSSQNVMVMPLLRAFRNVNLHGRHTFRKQQGAARQLCRALKYMHERSVLHCNLSVANVLAMRHRVRMFLADFGSSIVLKAGEHPRYRDQNSVPPYASVNRYECGKVQAADDWHALAVAARFTGTPGMMMNTGFWRDEAVFGAKPLKTGATVVVEQAREHLDAAKADKDAHPALKGDLPWDQAQKVSEEERGKFLFYA